MYQMCVIPNVFLFFCNIIKYCSDRENRCYRNILTSGFLSPRPVSTTLSERKRES